MPTSLILVPSSLVSCILQQYSSYLQTLRGPCLEPSNMSVLLRTPAPLISKFPSTELDPIHPSNLRFHITFPGKSSLPSTKVRSPYYWPPGPLHFSFLALSTLVIYSSTISPAGLHTSRVQEPHLLFFNILDSNRGQTLIK